MSLAYSMNDCLIDWLHISGVESNVVIVTHNTTINLTCTTSGRRTPAWFVNGTQVPTNGDKYSVRTSNGVYKTAALTINGNLTCETVNVYCEVLTTERQFVHMHNTTLRFQGWLQSFFCYWHRLLHQCIVNWLPLKPWHSQVAFPNLKMCISKSNLTQPLDGNLLTLQGTMIQTASMWTLTSLTTLYTLLTIILETLSSKRMWHNSPPIFNYMMVCAQCTKSQLGMLVVRVNWVNQYGTVHLKVNKLKISYRPSHHLLLLL